MKICFPVTSNEGLDSQVYGHFGSAPMFVVVDTESGKTAAINNSDQGHAYGACHPLKALGGEKVDVIVVSGIGGGALQGLKRAGLKVYQAQAVTIADNITCLDQESLPEFTSGQVCGGHNHGHSCKH